ncbi:glutathione S-transferase [Zalerion maritima]|uniref:Glutathione S-transferase n=1 Tax=Zalerion maritima TaxID=339359 RepID=A0AAD5WPE3_9PEZI|nr:glutathione S-transferase [Zalerion maritima]
MSLSITPYELIYWPGIPGRGEHVRLALEATGTLYTDVAKSDPGVAVSTIQSLVADDAGDNTSSSPAGVPGNPPGLAPPFLRHGDRVLISQTPNILLYLAQRLGLAGAGSAPGDGDLGMYHVNQLVLTALDGLSDEAHDAHHPIASGLYYEDQRAEAKRRAENYRGERLPKFLGYFERVIKGNEERGGKGGWLYGGGLTAADLVVFQGVDGIKYAFPKAMGKLEASGNYDRVFALHKAVAGLPKVKAYLESERRAPYGMGIYRKYPELDDE